jgi:DNA-directed RNA polymerase
MKGEDPWQLLATCMELTDALRHPVPSEFESRIPIHQDGTCNGLQHYAALGGDKLGAAQVNLIPSEKPSDIYTAVAERVSKRIIADADKGCEISKLMKGKISRKLVKQTVMTNTYGVTFIGARKQVISRLKESPDVYPFSDDQLKSISYHITHLIFDGLAELFTGARSLQGWLNTTARMIAKSIPESDIPPIQLEDAKEFDRMGVLPSPFTAARNESIDLLKEERESLENSDSLLGAALDEVISDDDVTSAQTEEDTLSKADAALATAVKTAKSAKQSSLIKPDRMVSVIWTTPLGLPIVQPYRELKTKQIQTLIQTVTVTDSHSPA